MEEGNLQGLENRKKEIRKFFIGKMGIEKKKLEKRDKPIIR
jgi:hypothetical protein